MRDIKIFVSSPGGFEAERQFIQQQISNYKSNAKREYKLVPIEAINFSKDATENPQAEINKKVVPSECDIVFVLLGERFGTKLPHPKFKKPDGTQYLSGTEWEYIDAHIARRKNAIHNLAKPRLYGYRRMQHISINPSDPSAREIAEQFYNVAKFFESDYFVNADKSILGMFEHYQSKEEFERKFAVHFGDIMKELIKDDEPKPRVTIPANYIPPSQKDFIGRSKEIEKLHEWSVSGSSILIMEGDTGTGKSSLAWKWFEEYVSESSDLFGALWINLEDSIDPIEQIIRDVYNYVKTDKVSVNSTENWSNPQNTNVDQVANFLRQSQQQGQDITFVPYNLINELKIKRFIVVLDGLNVQSTDIHHLVIFLKELVHCTPSQILITTQQIPTMFNNEKEFLSRTKILPLNQWSPEEARFYFEKSRILISNQSHWETFIADVKGYPILISIVAALISKSPNSLGSFDLWYQHIGHKLNLKGLPFYKQLEALLKDAPLPSPPENLPQIPSIIANPFGSRQIKELQLQLRAAQNPDEKSQLLAQIELEKERYESFQAEDKKHYELRKQNKKEIVKNRLAQWTLYSQDVCIEHLYYRNKVESHHEIPAA